VAGRSRVPAHAGHRQYVRLHALRPFTGLRPNSACTRRRAILNGEFAAGDARALGLNSKHLAGSNSVDGFKCVWQERQQILKRIAHAAKHDNSDLSLRHVLLKLKVLISGDEDAEVGGVEQRAVLKSRP
jgi:hypothetical protein